MNHTAEMRDSLGRRFPYLRLSLTDLCNFKCSYCLPDGYKRGACHDVLQLDELKRLVSAFVALGVWKIRLTGGEPTLRPDFISIAESIATIPGVKRLAFTTNGYRLPERAQAYFDAGLRAINISIDSLKAKQFKLITGHDRFHEVMLGVAACLEAGFQTIKINTVLLKGLNDDELDAFIDFVADKPISLRFIELMRTLDNQQYFETHHLRGGVVEETLLARGWSMAPRPVGAGPAVEFTHPNSRGSIGLITPYARDFCQTCNRLRVSATGDLHLCLFGDGGYSLKPWLQHDEQQPILRQKIIEQLAFKKSAHALHDNNSGVREHLASIGG